MWAFQVIMHLLFAGATEVYLLKASGYYYIIVIAKLIIAQVKDAVIN